MGLLSDLFGGGGGGGDQYRQRAIQEFQNLYIPTEEEQYITPTELVQMGILTPEQAEVYTMGPSAYEDIALDPITREAQLKSLQYLQGVGEQEGMGPIEKARMMEIQDELGTSIRGAREATAQNMAERGISGSGMELAQNLIAQQGAAGRASKQATQMEADAAQRALQAMTASGQMGGQIRQQDYGQAANRAAAADAIAKFNLMNRQNVQEQNIGRRERATEKNLGEKQRISDYNKMLKQQEDLRRSGLKQQKYENQYRRAAGMGGQYEGMAQSADASEQAKRQMWGNLIGLGGMLGSAAIMASDEELKEQMAAAGIDVDKFLESLKPVSYNYKNPKRDGEGRQYGVTAQDLEESPMGDSIVVDTPDGKGIDTQRAVGPILASLGELYERQEDMEEEV